ncbi:MAG: sodium:solute symporter [Chthoniobacteraceae bacterium]
MTPLDWLFVTIPLLIVFSVAAYTRFYMRSVADFLSSGRLAGRYLLSVARAEVEAGAVVFVAFFEVVSHAGFTLAWWQWISVPVSLLVAISGFVVYRFRETRAMTLSQFFEQRYSKKFRLFTGALGFLAGMVNFGIIPAVGSRFMIHVLDLPEQVKVFSYDLPTYIILMAVLLSITLIMTLSGGLISVMLTNCIEGLLVQIFFIVIIASLIMTFKWAQISEVLMAQPPGHSLLNPFDSMGLQDFNLWYVLMSIIVSVYGTMAWQNAGAYKTAAITPHESVMGGILANWKEQGKVAFVTLLTVCALTYLHHPDFASQAAAVGVQVHKIADTHIQSQMEIPIAVSQLLPVGVKGVFCAMLLLGIFGGDSTHLHSWGSIFIQDVVLPLRRKPLEPRQHIRYLRLSVIGVACFAFVFGIIFRQTEYIMMWWQMTMAIYVGGAGAAIIGGLYWKKGTTTAAWVALVTGSTLAVGGILVRNLLGGAFPLNGTQISFVAMVSAVLLYIIVSLLTCKKDYDMDRLLHRGRHALDEPVVAGMVPEKKAQGFNWSKVIGVDKSFSRGDRRIAIALFSWTMLWFCVFAVGTLWNLVAPWPVAVWSTYWHITGVGIPVASACLTAVWFTWGGVRDIRKLFRLLAEQKVNPLDDGTVVGNMNLGEPETAKDGAKSGAL